MGLRMGFGTGPIADLRIESPAQSRNHIEIGDEDKSSLLPSLLLRSSSSSSSSSTSLQIPAAPRLIQ
ncbi:hypothetical protein CRG98_045044, partial [Punica granatum]